MTKVIKIELSSGATITVSHAVALEIQEKLDRELGTDQREMKARIERSMNAMLRAGFPPDVALADARRLTALIDGEDSEITKLRETVSRLNAEGGSYERAYEETVPEPATAKNMRKRLGQLVNLVVLSTGGTSSQGFVDAMTRVRDELVPMLRKVGVVTFEREQAIAQNKEGARIAADRVQERALAWEGKCIQIERDDPDSGSTLQWARSVARELRVIERELRDEAPPSTAPDPATPVLAPTPTVRPALYASDDDIIPF